MVSALLALHHRAQHEFETFRDAYPAEGGAAAHQAMYLTVLVGEAALRNVVGSLEVMQHQIQHVARLAGSLTHARVGVVPLSRCPILPLHGWEQRDIVSIETTAGDFEIADPDEVAQYERWADLLTAAAINDHIEDLVVTTGAPTGR